MRTPSTLHRQTLTTWPYRTTIAQVLRTASKNRASGLSSGVMRGVMRVPSPRPPRMDTARAAYHAAAVPRHEATQRSGHIGGISCVMSAGRRVFAFTLLVVSLVAGGLAPASAKPAGPPTYVYVGTEPGPKKDGKGIYVFRLQTEN